MTDPNLPDRRAGVIITVIIVVLAVIALAVVVLAVWGPRGVTAPNEPGPTPGASAPAPNPPSATADPVGTPDAPPPAVPDTPPNDLDEPAQVVDDVEVRITLVEAVDGIARGPGEVAAPALRVTVRFTNSTASAVPLHTTIVSAYYGADLTPAPELREPGGSPLPASVAAGQSVVGVFLFTVPESERSDVTIMVDHSTTVDPVLFRGDISTLMT